jgi:DNA-binding transcriptional regulator/RsmH inhibitor MraZ
VEQIGPVQPAAVESPRGAHEVSVDSKGRLKLPSTFKGYFETIQEKSFFVTTIDGRLLYIYPLSVWRQNEALLESMTGSHEEMAAAESILGIANHYGADASIDGEGRMLVPQEVRKELGINDSKVWLKFEKGKIVGYSALEYKKMLDAAKEGIGSKLQAVKLKGLR